MRNPLSMFRRHQKVLLAVFGVIIIITFTIGGSVSYYQDTAMRSAREGDVVVTWRHGKFTEEDIYGLRNTHARTVRFLDSLVIRALEAGGTPRAAGITRDPRTGQIRDPGIPRSNAEELLVQTVILARKARDMGVVISDQAILDFLDQVSDYKVPRRDYGALLRDATGGTMGQPQLFEQLRMELQAQNVRLLANSGMSAITPAEAWEYFNRMNRRVRAEVLPLPVEDFVSQVSREPAEAEVRALYDEGKDRYPNPSSPEPGFKRPLKIAFDYLKADFEQFLTREAARVSDQEVKAYYEENLADFKVPDLPPSEASQTGPDAPSDQDAPGDAAPEETSPEAVPADPEAAPAEQPVDAVPEEAAPAEEPSAPAGETADGDRQAPPEGDTGTAEEPSEEATEEAADEVTEESAAQPADEATEEAASDEPESAQLSSGAATFVAFRPQAEEAGEEAGEAAEESPAESAEPAANEAPAEDGTEQAAAAQPAADEATTDGAPAAEAQPVRYKPLEEVADQIRTSIARPKAQDAVDEAVKQAKREVDAYFRARARAQALQAQGGPAGPPPLDTATLAEKYNLIPGETPLVDAREIADYELGQAYTFSFAQGQVQTIPFAQIAYAEGIPLYRPAQIRSFEVNVEFLYWKTEQEEPYVPELSDVREEVVRAWKLRQAVDLAQTEARQLAEKASSEASLKETLGEPYTERVRETNEFTWMTRGATPGGFGIPSISPVEGVESPGQAFMETVFRLEPGRAGVALNQPQTICYVVRVISQAPDEQQLRERFLLTGLSDETFFMAFMDQQQLLQDWYQSLEQQMNVHWQRAPQALGMEEF